MSDLEMMQQGMGQGAFSEAVANQLVQVIKPSVMKIVSEAATAAEPTIRTVIREEVMPKIALFSISGIVLVGVLGALVGSYFATRR